jgi:hypothetical protein
LSLTQKLGKKGRFAKVYRKGLQGLKTVGPYLIEVVTKPPLGLNPRVGPRHPILEIFPIFLRLAATVRLDLEPD